MSAPVRRTVSLDGALVLARRALGLLLRDNPSVFMLADLGEIDLPPADDGAGDVAALRLATPMYVACELQQAGLLDMLETLAALYVSGGITADVGAAAETLADVWRTRNATISPEERVAFCRRTFRPAGRAPFDNALLDLCDAIIEPEDVRRTHPSPRSVTRIRHAVRSLAAAVSQQTGGVPPIAAREMLAAVERALQVLGVAEVRTWLGARSTWAALEVANERFGRGRGPRPDVRRHVDRAKSGAVLLGWSADVLAAHGLRVPVAVADAAQEWIDATAAMLDVEAA
jgi:hypothetical protein